ncbi:MAG: WD40 repeat domain-containing protein [Candidatus Obscuribacterales bacterium]|nr:WD40 repeat domain-containing protein [Candidatus Obscuribacterales bacterium]
MPETASLHKVGSLLSHVAWSPDDLRIVACYGDEPPRVILAKTRQIERDLMIEDDDPNSKGVACNFVASWSQDGSKIALGRNQKVHIVDARTGEECLTHSVVVNPRNSKESLSALGKDQILARLQAIGNQDEQIRCLEKHIGTLNRGVISLKWLDSGVIAVGTPVGAYTWDLDEHCELLTLRPNPCPGQVRSPSFSKSGQYFASVFYPAVDVLTNLYWNFNKSLQIARPVLNVWDVKDQAVVAQYQGDDLPFLKTCRLYWSHDEKQLAWTHDNKLIVLDLAKQRTRVLVRSQEHLTDCLAWSPDNKQLAVFDSQEGVIIYDTNSGVKQTAYKDALWGRYRDIGVRNFAWSNKGDALVVGSSRYSVDVWRFWD